MFFSNTILAMEWELKNLGSLATKSQMLPDQVKKDATCSYRASELLINPSAII